MAEPEHKTLKALFVGLGNSRVCWYRVTLPAMYLGCDWMGVVGVPPHLQFLTGYVNGGTAMAKLDSYDVVIVQQPRGGGWFKLIQSLRRQGIVVLYEIDDYVHGIRKARDHDFSEHFQTRHLKAMELCMRACDGLICSTEYIARRYRSIVPRVWVCENGLDMARYRLTLPPRGKLDGNETVTLGWSGATGHRLGVEPWLEVVERVMRKHPHICFASIGQDFAGTMGAEFGQRVISIPFAALETYPSAMTLFDIALAPAGDTGFYAGKSTLRAMEAAALGIPVVADPHYETAVDDGKTGYVAHTQGETLKYIERLVEHKSLRRTMGDMAREKAEREFDMKVRRESWQRTVIEAWEARHAA